MNEEQKRKLEAASRIGKGMWFKDKTTGKRSCLGTIEDEVYIFVGDYKHLIQRIHFNPRVSWEGNRRFRGQIQEMLGGLLRTQFKNWQVKQFKKDCRI